MCVCMYVKLVCTYILNVPLKDKENPPDKVCPRVAVVLIDWISGMCGAEDYICMYVCMSIYFNPTISLIL